MKITILSNNTSIEEYIDKTSQGNVVDSFYSIEQLLTKTKKSSHRTQLLIIQDNAIDDDKFDFLYELLNHKFFYCEKIVFLNLALNKDYLSRYEFLKEEVENKGKPITIEIITQDGFKSTDLLRIIKEGTSYYEDIQVDDVAIIQKARTPNRQLLSNKVLEEKPIDGIIIDNFKKDTPINTDETPINIKSSHNIKIDVETFEDEINSIEKQIEVSNTSCLKYLAVTGARNSGVTSTSISMGLCASKFGKTLIVDCDVVSLGLSLMSEIFTESPALIEAKSNDIPVNSVLKYKTTKYLKIASMDSSELHFLTLDYKSVSKIGDMSIMLINIINQIKDNYRYIIFDIPLELINTYSVLLNKYIEKILLVNIPYVNKTVNLLRKVKDETIIPMTSLYKNNDVIIFNVGIPNQNNLPVITRSELNIYIQNLFNKEFKCTKIFQLVSGNYLEAMEHFKSIMEVMIL